MRKSFLLLLAAVIIVIFLNVRTRPVHSQSTGQMIYLPLVLSNYSAPISLRTRIVNIAEFLDHCPTKDPQYSQMRSDFIIIKNGVTVGDIFCSEPISSMPTNLDTQELILLKALRAIYYMDTAAGSYLPWTSMSFYGWMTSQVGGIEIKGKIGDPAYCCDVIGGRRYIVTPPMDLSGLNATGYRTWTGLSGTVGFLAHEARHADGQHPHDSGCGYPNGCDPTYDVNNLGAYGIQYWLNYSWMSGYINIGIGCSGDAENIVEWHRWVDNTLFRNMFSTNMPPIIDKAPTPYGGPCFVS